jgi:hypothetical protein
MKEKLEYRLKFYEMTNKIFEKEANTNVPKQHIDIISRKLSKHFNFEYRGWFNGKIRTCKARAWLIRRLVELNPHYDPSLLTLCEELAHLWDKQTGGDSRHSKRLLRKITRLINYCNKNKKIQSLLKRKSL